MPKIPKSPYRTELTSPGNPYGALIKTQSPHKEHRVLFLMGYRLDESGRNLKKAYKDFNEFERQVVKLEALKESLNFIISSGTVKEEEIEKKTKEIEELDKEVTDEKKEQLIINIAIESLRQQYKLFYKENAEEKEQEVTEDIDSWNNFIRPLFTDRDLERIIMTINTQKSWTIEEIWDYARDTNQKKL